MRVANAAAVEAEYAANEDVRRVFDELDNDSILFHVGLYKSDLDRRVSQDALTDALVAEIMASRDETRFGFYLVGAEQSPENHTFTMEAFRRGAVLGDRQCMEMYAYHACSAHDPHFYFWYDKASSDLLETKIIDERAYFAAGRYFVSSKARIDEEDSGFIIIHSLRVYKKARTATIDAINTWSLVAKQLGVGHDVRKLIARLVWNEMESFNVDATDAPFVGEDLP